MRRQGFGEMRAIRAVDVWSHYEYCISDDDPNGEGCSDPSHPHREDVLWVPAEVDLLEEPQKP